MKSLDQTLRHQVNALVALAEALDRSVAHDDDRLKFLAIETLSAIVFDLKTEASAAHALPALEARLFAIVALVDPLAMAREVNAFRELRSCRDRIEAEPSEAAAVGGHEAVDRKRNSRHSRRPDAWKSSRSLLDNARF